MVMLIPPIDANPQLHMQQQHLLQQQRAQQARNMMAQQFNTGMPMSMANGIPPQMNAAAQFAAMRGGPSIRSVGLPQHLQQQQQQAQLGAIAQEQAQQQAAQQQVIHHFTTLSST
jgi:hypothetical protein